MLHTASLLLASKETWDTFKTLTSYQDLDGGNILPLLDKDNNPVFELEQKCQILQNTFFSGIQLQEKNLMTVSRKNLKLNYQISIVNSWRVQFMMTLS